MAGGERDELMTHAWPELRRFCRERQVGLVEVDMRWGIAEEQSVETLKLCLDEIRACCPCFIGLLGERYGWVPGDDHGFEKLVYSTHFELIFANTNATQRIHQLFEAGQGIGRCDVSPP